MSTNRRQARPEGAAGIRKSSGSHLGVHRHVDVAVDDARSIGAPAVEGEGQRVARGGEVGLAGSTPCQRMSGGSPPPPPVKKVRRLRTGWAFRNAIIILHEPEEAGVAFAERPVDPADGVVLAPGVVVAVLGAEELVAAQDHRHALRDHQRRDQVARLAARGSRARPDRRSAPRRRSSSSSWRRCRRGFPRRWPRCACGCTRPGRSG